MTMRNVNTGNERNSDFIARNRSYQSCAVLRCFALLVINLSFGIDGAFSNGIFPPFKSVSLNRFLTTSTNDTLNKNSSNVTITSNSSTEILMENNYSFCMQPNDSFWSTPYRSCKMESDTWSDLLSLNFSMASNKNTNDTSSYQTEDSDTPIWSGECGPQCRPSCVTLLLDLDRLRSDDFLCPNGDENSCSKPCEHISQSSCRSNTSDSLYQLHPTCYLEEAQCHGPTIYEDIAALYESLLPANSSHALPALDHCSAIPHDDFYHRFHGWNVISPLNRRSDDCHYNSTNTSCFNDSSKIYFEYCNVLEEDYVSCRTCEATNDTSCIDHQTCPKIIQPFPDGWTTFVVSASIPFPNQDSSCRRASKNTTGVDAVCFLQRIQLYYPPSCPHCHACPQIALGDTFGPLEVVGFGHSIQQNCAPCHQPSLIANRSAHSLSCRSLERCHELVDCSTGASLGLPSFVDNHCSFQVEVDEDFTDPDDDFFPQPETERPSTVTPTTPPLMTLFPSLSPDGSMVVDQNDTLGDNGTSVPDNEDPSNIVDAPETSSKHRLSPLVVSLIVMGLVVVVAVQIAIYRKIMATQREPPRRIAEEIVYIEPLEFDGIDKMLASDASHNTADDDPTDSDTDNPSNWSPPWRNVNPITSEKMQQEIRHFQTASILERSDQNEVEALYMTGLHHIQLPP